jgi:hypothetical protein
MWVPKPRLVERIIFLFQIKIFFTSKSIFIQSGKVAHDYNYSTQKAEAGWKV